MEEHSSPVAPPGASPLDSSVQEIDAVAFALERVETYLAWIEEHRVSLALALTKHDGEASDREMDFLADATTQARLHIARLKELIVAGYSIDPAKRLLKGFR